MIAVIDDDESMGRSLARFLKASGFQSVLFRSAEGFLADPQHPRFDCLIVDLQLGGMSGIALRDRLRSAGVNTRMIFMTARDSNELDKTALQIQGDTLLRKSDPGEMLLAILRRASHGCQQQ